MFTALFHVTGSRWLYRTHCILQVVTHWHAQTTVNVKQYSVCQSKVYFCQARFSVDVIKAVLRINSSIKSDIEGRKRQSTLTRDFPLFQRISVCVLLAKWPRLNWVTDGWNWLKENRARLSNTHKHTQFTQRSLFSVAPFFLQTSEPPSPTNSMTCPLSAGHCGENVMFVHEFTKKKWKTDATKL